MNMEMAVRAGGPDKEFKISKSEKKVLFEMVAAHNALQVWLFFIWFELVVDFDFGWFDL